MIKEFSIRGFRAAIGRDFLRPSGDGYGYVDHIKFHNLQKDLENDTKRLRVPSIFTELEKRMSREYYHHVFLAQARAMHYASTHFPAYSMVMAEDLTEDWLATVDFHKKHSRDHSLHQPLTAYIVAELLGYGNELCSFQIPACPGNLLGFCVDSVFSAAGYILQFARELGLPKELLNAKNANAREYWRKCFYEAAIMSALFHDMGYPWQYVGRINSSLESLSPIFSKSEVELESLMNVYENRLAFLPFRRYNFHYPNESPKYIEERRHLYRMAMGGHGLPGAITFLALNDAIRLSPSETPRALFHELIVEWAAMGLVMHDMVGIRKKIPINYLRLNYRKDPMSSLICLADYLEEFNRPQSVFTPNLKSSKLEYLDSCSKVSIDVDANNDLRVSMYYPTEGSSALAGDFKSIETEDYFNPSTGFLDLSSLGIRNVFFNRVVETA